MSVKKYLTLDGLTYFLNKIKSTMADELDGKANDSEVLHKAQTETVTGEKTFKKDVKIIDLNANERPGVKFEVNGSFRTFEEAKDSLPDPDFGDFGGGTLWDGGFLADNTKIQNSMGDYVINDITFGTANYSSVIEFNNYYKVTYEDGHNSPEDVTGMLRFELAPYENVEKDHEYWSDPDLYLYAMLDGGFSGGSTILGNPRAPWSKAYIGEINCEDIKFGFGMVSIFDAFKNIQNLSYVTHYSSTALTPSSTNSNTLLDNTDNLKVGDKVIDSSGVLFSITAIDTQNSTFTIGTALVDLAQDSDVVHKSGNEIVGGSKTFTDSMRLKSNVAEYGVTEGNIQFYLIDKNNFSLSKITQGVYNNGVSYITLQLYGKDSNNQTVTNTIRYQYSSDFGYSYLLPTDNSVQLGSTGNRWKSIFATNYYYGSNNVEFSTKFVTTDTNQTISGNKTFSSNTYVYNSDNTATTPNLYLKSSKVEVSSQGNTSGDQNLVYLDKNNTVYAYVKGAIQSNGSAVKIRAVAKNSSDNSVINELQMLAYTNGNKSIFPSYSNEIDLGTSSYKWKSFNGVEPSSLSMPDLSNGIDISSYIDVTQTSQYTAPANGYISICGYASSTNAILIKDHDYDFAMVFRALTTSLGATTYFVMPVIKNHVYDISCSAVTNIAYAKFYPCQGNV